MYVHVCDITTCTTSKYEHERHTYHSRKYIEFNNFKNRIIPSRETYAQGIGGSMRISRHSALLDVADHSRCRTMFTVQSLERPPECRRSEKEKKTSANIRKKRAVAETHPKNLIARTPKPVSLCRWRFRRPALPTLRARRGLGRRNSGATQEKNNGAICCISSA